MLFSSITFLYIFLPLVICSYGIISILPVGGKSHLTGKRSCFAQNILLLVASLVFYAWGEPVYVLLMLVQIAVTYGLTLWMEKKRETWIGRIAYILAIVFPLASLFYYKYSGFIYQVFLKETRLFGKSLAFLQEVTLPIGISFYTFQMISYVIDVHRKRVACQKKPLYFACYVALFPQLIAGPIVRYSDIEVELDHRQWTAEKMYVGIVRFSVGLAKKVLLANTLGEFVVEVSKLQERTILLSWGYALAVFLQIYFDFSGYSDMAIGLGRMFGFKFPENFQYPMISKSISEFWRRWHMTLGSWFRDYVYIPLGGNRVPMWKWIRNIFIVWFLTGFWHGAGWNFMIWGLFFGVLLLLEKVTGISDKKEIQNCSKSVGATVKLCCVWIFKHLYVVVMVLISFLIFNASDMQTAWQDIQGLWKNQVLTQASAETSAYLLRNRLGLLVIALIGATPLPNMCWQKVNETCKKSICVSMIQCVLVLLSLVLCTAYLVDGSFNPFLYFRF